MWNWLSRNPSCPISDAEREVVEYGFAMLDSYLGQNRISLATVIEPTPDFFPDPYRGTEESVFQLFERVCGFMGLDPNDIDFGLFDSQEDESSTDLLALSAGPRSSSGTSGYFVNELGRDQIWIDSEVVKDPEFFVSTLAHELAHVILISHCGQKDTEPHLEAITDLATIYLGMGIFTANTILTRHGWVEGNTEGWAVRRRGYISPEMAGWALSLFCWRRGELEAKWARHLNHDPRSYLKKGLKYLRHINPPPT